MSMYTQLLDAALGERPDAPTAADDSEHGALDELLRCRAELDQGVDPAMDPDTVPTVLALQIGYDVALLQLARVVGIDSDPHRFDQPQRERERLESALRDRGISLDVSVADDGRVPDHS